jgi:hypothetical protein
MRVRRRAALAFAPYALSAILPANARAADDPPREADTVGGAETDGSDGASKKGPSDGASKTDASEGAPKTRPSAIGIAAAIVPGILVHGAGHFAAGDPQTASRLLMLEGIGVGTLAAGFIPIVLTGASRRLVGPAAALSIVGVGLFAVSMLSDLYGVATPEGGLGAAPTTVAIVQIAGGYRYVFDPVFAYRSFMAYEIDYRVARWRVDPSAWFALNSKNSRLRALGSYRFMGPLPEGEPRSRGGSFLDLEGAVTRHAYTSDHFATTTFELSVAGRVDLDHLATPLKGSFAELSLGAAVASYHYDVPGAANDLGELLLARFAYGVYFGWPRRMRGEAMIYYDHRHDGFAAGLKVPGLGSGVAGHFGVDARMYLTDRWGIAAEAAVGSAYVAGLSVLFRHGDPL